MIYTFFEATLQVCCSFYFILYKKHYEEVNIDCPIICLICVSQYTPQVGHEAEMFIFSSHGNLKRMERGDSKTICAIKTSNKRLHLFQFYWTVYG